MSAVGQSFWKAVKSHIPLIKFRKAINGRTMEKGLTSGSSPMSRNPQIQTSSDVEISNMRRTVEGKIDPRTHYYPNTSVGIKERTSKPSGKVQDPIQKPIPPFPDGKNPKTGEIGGPAGPEPTRFGDWERKGRVSDF